MKTGTLHAAYVDPTNDAMIAGAEQLLETARSYHSQRRADLHDAFVALQRQARDKKLIDGIFDVLVRSCTFDKGVEADPVELRAFLFSQAAAQFPVGVADNCPRRNQILLDAAQRFGIPPENVESAMFADLADEQLLSSVPPWTPQQLLQRYNLALAQGVLLNAQFLEITLRSPTPGRLRQLVRFLKFFRLLFQVEHQDHSILVLVDGPLSILEHAKAYGTRFASLLPALLLLPDFSLKARVKWREKWGEFVVDSKEGLRSHYPDKGAWVPKELELFANALDAALPHHNLSLSPEFMIPLGAKDAFVPDIELEGPNGPHWIEIVWPWQRLGDGHWISLFQKHAPKGALALVSSKAINPKLAKNLLASTKDDRIFFFKITPPSEKVAMAILEKEGYGADHD